MMGVPYQYLLLSDLIRSHPRQIQSIGSQPKVTLACTAIRRYFLPVPCGAVMGFACRRRSLGVEVRMRTPESVRPRPRRRGRLVLVGVALLGVAACREVPLPTAQAAPDVLAALRANGEAHVVVALVNPPSPADSPDAAAQRRAEIARLQREVLARLGPNDFVVRELFVSVPAIAGTVLSERGLSVLLGHPNVRRVDLDPAGGGSGGR